MSKIKAKKIPRSFWVDVEDLEKLKIIAEKTGVSQSDIVRQGIKKEIAHWIKVIEKRK